jgi:uncharacterized protein (TIGR03118 family)
MFKTAAPTCALALLLAGAYSANCDTFVQTNLVSDVPGLAPVTDPNLKNPWGVSFSATSPIWVSNAASNTTTLYNSSNQLALTVAISGGPTGQINVPNTLPSTDFPVNGTSNATRASFVFDTLAGNIDAWNGGSAATLQASHTGAAYTGLTFGTVGTTPFLYAANFAQNSIDVYNAAWAPATVAGSFNDPNLPAGYKPFNIQNINGNLYVEYAQAGTGPTSPGRGAGLGIVDVYNTNGALLQTLISPGGQLNAPWGVVLAPAGFGSFGGDLLVGNFGNGQINAFNAITGAFLGTLDGPSGNPLVNANLWALAIRAAGSGFDANGVYFTAGINGQNDGLYGVIDAAPEPGTFTLLLVGSGIAGGVLLRRRRA